MSDPSSPDGGLPPLRRTTNAVLAVLILISVVLGFACLVTLNDSHNHGWVMRSMQAGAVCLLFAGTSLALVRLSELGIRAPGAAWLLLVLTGLVMYLGSAYALRETLLVVQWGLPLVCLAPVYVIRLRIKMNLDALKGGGDAQEEKP